MNNKLKEVIEINRKLSKILSEKVQYEERLKELSTESGSLSMIQVLSEKLGKTALKALNNDKEYSIELDGVKIPYTLHYSTSDDSIFVDIDVSQIRIPKFKRLSSVLDGQDAFIVYINHDKFSLLPEVQLEINKRLDKINILKNKVRALLAKEEDSESLFGVCWRYLHHYE